VLVILIQGKSLLSFYLVAKQGLLVLSAGRYLLSRAINLITLHS
jgi:hypothetical protein